MNIGRRFLSDEDFEGMWRAIEREMAALASGGVCRALEIYNSIYAVCTSSTPRLENRLYWKIGDFLYMRAREIRKEVFEAREWVQEYNRGFRRFKEVVFAVDELCEFLNECVKGRTMRDLGFLLWERCVLQQTHKYKHTTLGAELVNHGEADVVREAIESLRLIVPDAKKPMLYYTQSYEQFALQKIGSKYSEEIESVCGDVERYSVYVKEKMEYERSVRDKIFLRESWQKMEAVLEEVFVLNRREHLLSEIHRVMCMHKLPIEMLAKVSGDAGCEKQRMESGARTNDFYELQGGAASEPVAPDFSLERMAVLYGNLSWLKSAYEVFREVFVRYIREESEKHMHVYGRSVESLYLFHCMLRHVVDVGFGGDREFLKILRREFSTSCMKLKPSLEARLLEFSECIVGGGGKAFWFLDGEFGECGKRVLGLAGEEVSVRGGELGAEFSEKSDFLRQVFGTLYKLVENKHVFYEMYLGGLGRRLLEKTPNPGEERKLILLMRRKGNQDFIRRAETMVADIEISLGYNKDAERFVWVLTQAYWPVQMEGLSVRVPEQLEAIRRVYDSKFNKKKLHWVWHLGDVSVSVYGAEIRMNVLQYSVVDLVGRHGQADFELIANSTRMGTKTTGDVLRSLVQGGVVEHSGELYMIGDVGKAEKDIRAFYCCESVSMAHEVDRNVYYQSVVSGILKRRKKMCMEEIAKEVLSAHTERFEYDGDVLQEGMRALCDKGIIEDVENVYVYLP